MERLKIQPWQYGAHPQTVESWKEMVQRCLERVRADPQRRQDWGNSIKAGWAKRTLLESQTEPEGRESIKKFPSERSMKCNDARLENMQKGFENKRQDSTQACQWGDAM
jgi:hypothetical protein